MKLRAIVTIDIEAADFVEAAEHQRQVEGLVEQLQTTYPSASLVLRERRLSGSKDSRNAAANWPAAVRPTGRLNRYAD